MSQNRQEEKDRRRAENDYKVNLKTEIMIEDLYDKVNAILAKQSALEKQLQKEEKKKSEIWEKERLNITKGDADIPFIHRKMKNISPREACYGACGRL